MDSGEEGNVGRHSLFRIIRLNLDFELCQMEEDETFEKFMLGS